jgi:hypothetical protein
LTVAAEFVKQVVPIAELCYFDGGHFVQGKHTEAIIGTFSR